MIEHHPEVAHASPSLMVSFDSNPPSREGGGFLRVWRGHAFNLGWPCGFASRLLPLMYSQDAPGLQRSSSIAIDLGVMEMSSLSLSPQMRWLCFEILFCSGSLARGPGTSSGLQLCVISWFAVSRAGLQGLRSEGFCLPTPMEALILSSCASAYELQASNA